MGGSRENDAKELKVIWSMMKALLIARVLCYVAPDKGAKTMKYFVSIAFVCALVTGCAQTQDQGGRALENAGSVVTSGGQHVWHAPDKSPKEKKEEEKAATGQAAAH